MHISMGERRSQTEMKQLLFFFTQNLPDLVFQLGEVPFTLKCEWLVLQYSSTA
jgi:hypothetical protein